jgi:hypothetical protein
MRKTMKTLQVLAAILVLGIPSARAEAILDLSAPQPGPASSMIDLSRGTDAPWDEIGIEIESGGTTLAAAGTSAAGTSSGRGVDEAGRKPANGGPQTQQVSGYVRRDGAAVDVRAARR